MRRPLLAAALVLSSFTVAGPATAGPECDDPAVRPHVHAGVNCYDNNGQHCAVYFGFLTETCAPADLEVGD